MSIETVVIALLGGFTVYSTFAIVRRLRYLEGFLLICVNCKKVQVDGEWLPFEGLLGRDERLKLSKGVCPECRKVHYSAYRL